jgi:hypothetical protein
MTHTSTATQNEGRQPAGRRSPARTGAVAVGLALTAGLVWQSSQAAFTASTNSPGNSWQAGKVSLSTSASGAAVFNTSDGPLMPGTGSSQCIDVTYSGDVAAEVRLYAANYSQSAGVDSTGNLGTLLSMKIEIGDDDCAGSSSWTTLRDAAIGTIASQNTNFSNGLTNAAWQPDGQSTAVRAYRFTPTLADDNSAQGDGLAVSFVWAAESA